MKRWPPQPPCGWTEPESDYRDPDTGAHRTARCEGGVLVVRGTGSDSITDGTVFLDSRECPNCKRLWAEGRMQRQTNEFAALDDLVKQKRRHDMTAVVDDDYPAIRHDYENALAAFIEAMKLNERFEPINRYGLVRWAGPR